MSLYNLDKLLSPASVAVVGASAQEGSVGAALVANLVAGGFAGPIYPINPKRSEIQGRPAYPSLSAVGRPIDLAVLATGIALAPELVAECGRVGVGAAIVISAGGKEAGEDGVRVEEAIIQAAKAAKVRVLGPNCMGVMNSRLGLNATFTPDLALPGKLAFISQSGAILTAILDQALADKIGFSHLVSVGSMLDVDFGDLIDHLGNDPEVEAILLYIESLTNHRKFMSAARAVSRVKPIIALKMGRSAAAARAALSHTGALTGEDAVYEAAFKRAGVVRVETIGDLFGCAELMAKQPRPKGPGLAIVVNVGGPGVMATEALAHYGLEPPQLTPATLARLDAVCPPFWSRNNPIDILGSGTPEQMRRVVEICAAAPEFDAVLVMTTPQRMYQAEAFAQAVAQAVAGRNFPIFTVFMGGGRMAEARRLFVEQGIPTYDSPERAARAFFYMYRYGRGLQLLQKVPPKLPAELAFDQAGGRRIVEAALAQGQSLLTEAESKSLLATYGIPVPRLEVAATAQEAVKAAGRLGYPVVLKLHSPDITHKSEAGGVRLNLASAEAVARAFERIRASAATYNPRARVQGVTVQPMVSGSGLELILGAKQDRDFGPVILFGMGGVLAEALQDRAVDLPPLNRLLARRLIERTKVFRLLKGFRHLAPANLTLLEEILLRLSQLVIDLPEVVELDINPLVLPGDTACALDARVAVAPAAQASPRHLALSPYPNQYEEWVTTRDGLTVFIRPIQPEDAPAHRQLFHELSPRTVQFRFRRPLTSMPPHLLARYTQIDYDRELALVALVREGEEEKIIGTARIIAHPDGREAELSLLVADAWQGRGLGEALYEKILAVARERGLQRLWGVVTLDNEVMLGLIRKAGQELQPIEDGRAFLASLELS